MKIGKARFGCVFGVILALSGPLWAASSGAAATPLLIAADDDMDYEDEDDGELDDAAPRPDIGQLRHWLNQRNRQRQGEEDSTGEDTREQTALDDDADTDSELIDTGRVWKSRSYYSRARYGKRHYRGHRWHSRRHSHRHHGFWHGHGRWQGRGHRHWHGDHRARHKKTVAIAHAQGRGGQQAVPALHGRLAKAATAQSKRLAAPTPVKAATRRVTAHLPAKSFKPVKSTQHVAKTTKATSSKASAPKSTQGKARHR